jgi:hypothetical protein
VLTKGLSVLETKSILGERTFFGPPRFRGDLLGPTASHRATGSCKVLQGNAAQT